MTDTTVEAPESIQEAAEFYAANNARFWRVLYRLRQYVADSGPIKLADGRTVGMFADGFSLQTEAIADEFPALVSSKSVTLEGQPIDVDRAISLVVEEVPALTVKSIGYTLDKDALNGALRGGGSAGERLKELRTLKSKLGCK